MKKKWLYLSVAALLLTLSSFAGNFEGGRADRMDDPDPQYDRLDGMGKAKVDLVEWGNNLEIHVYPKGRLTGLAMKMIRDNGKKIMVIRYRFSIDPNKTETRRALISIGPLNEKFYVYEERHSDPEYSKYVVMPQPAPPAEKQYVSYQLEPEPTQLYPDGHPAIAGNAPQEQAGAAPRSDEQRKPANAPKKRSAEESEGSAGMFSF